MLKKMKEESAKRRMPTAPSNRDEAVAEAPGLRVGRDVWKWPPYWPYDDGIFQSKATIEAKAAASQPDVRGLAMALSGVAAVPGEELADPLQSAVLDPLQYWGAGGAGDLPTAMDADAVDKLKAHYEYYLPAGCSVLELGAAEESYLPESLRPLSRHVGVSAAGHRMAQNPSITESLVVDLNKVVPGRDIDSEALRSLASDQFDAILMSNTVDYLSFPREVFRTAWYLLKPGGVMIVAFSGKDASKNAFVEAQTKIWSDYNDDQHLWITGSFFQFSASTGWDNLLGFDISPESAKKTNENPILNALQPGKNNNLFVVQATKGFQYQAIDPNAIEESISSLSWMLPVLEERDKSLILPRLSNIYRQEQQNQPVRDAIQRNIPALPIIYESLSKMDTFAFTFSMQAQLASDLISDPHFDAKNDAQILSMKQGLGLRTPSPDFWLPVGQNTAAMNLDDRISLLAFLVPRFGSNNPITEAALTAFATGLAPTFAVLRYKCPDMSESDIQLLGTELLATELLGQLHNNNNNKHSTCTPYDFATWLDCMTTIELYDLLQGRKALRDIAAEDYKAYRIAKIAEKERLEEYKRKYDEQVRIARLERSLIFNPRTTKMQIFDNPNNNNQQQSNDSKNNLFNKLFSLSK